MKRETKEDSKKKVGYLKNILKRKKYGNRELTLKEQKKVLDFLTTQCFNSNVKIYWHMHFSLYGQCIPSWCSGYLKKEKRWDIYIPKPTTLYNVSICLHELGHTKLYSLHNLLPSSISCKQAFQEAFADVYSYQISKHLGIKWSNKMWTFRKYNAKCYNVKEASKFNYKNFYIKPLHLI